MTAAAALLSTQTPVRVTPPLKPPPGSEQGPSGSPPPARQRQPGVKRVRLMAERSAERAGSTRHQRHQRPVATAAKGEETGGGFGMCFVFVKQESTEIS